MRESTGTIVAKLPRFREIVSGSGTRLHNLEEPGAVPLPRGSAVDVQRVARR